MTIGVGCVSLGVGVDSVTIVVDCVSLGVGVGCVAIGVGDDVGNEMLLGIVQLLRSAVALEASNGRR
ncbi:MAG: hypothetical protein HXY43_10840 [Fischerella sp.]|uniref:hypothetical protein n=1 Tax=Fischerella sp. TaxID=1191 RepID=UPI001797B99C|nr:hypothetical protein [Fischerella sp.]NWF59764.1 hypothetical protein [Fischerella sp.]